MKLTETRDGVVVEVFVKPNSPQFEVALEGDEVVVRCTEEPVKGKVNKELIKGFTKLFHAKVELVSGATSKQKKFLIVGAEKIKIEQLLRSNSS
jgi:uncharacterized protein (TIGR00251 family)